jgi:DNA polymerase/3'-5' exonuclease PolX
MNKTEKLANVLDEYSTYLELDGQDGRAHAYDKAARSIRARHYLPPDPSNIDNIGENIRTKIAQYQRNGEIEELSKLKEEYTWFTELNQVKHIGPSRAEQLHEKFNIETIDDLILVGDDITLLPRVGEKRAQNILDSAHEIRNNRQ